MTRPARWRWSVQHPSQSMLSSLAAEEIAQTREFLGGCYRHRLRRKLVLRRVAGDLVIERKLLKRVMSP